MYQFLLSTIPQEWRRAGLLAGLRDRVGTVTRTCGICPRFAPRRGHGVQVPTITKYNERVWADSAKASEAVDVLIVTDEGTGEAMVEPLKRPASSAAAWDAIYIRWLAVRGAPKEMVTDGGGELGSNEFNERCERAGITPRKTASASSESHGRVERTVRTLRWSLDRIVSEMKREPTMEEWRIICATVENSMRSEILVGGFSSSQRALGGANISLGRSVVSENRVTGSVPEDDDDVARVAMEAFRETRNSDRLRKMLAQRSSEARSWREYAIGDKIMFCREERKGRGARWHGPAYVAGITEHYAQIDSAGRLIRVGWRDIEMAEADAEVQTNLPAIAEARGATADEPGEPADDADDAEDADDADDADEDDDADDDGCMPEMPIEMAGAGDDVAAPSDCVACRQRERGVRVTRPHGVQCKRAQRCMMGVPGTLHSDLCEQFELVSDSDSESGDESEPESREFRRTCYAMLASDETPEEATGGAAPEWEDLPSEVRDEAIAQGLRDYDETGSWDRQSDTSCAELKRQGKTVLSGREVGRSKWKNGEWIGRWRYTPRGFEERNLESAVDSPTASKSSHRTLEVLGLAKCWTAYTLDVSSAFFKGLSFAESAEQSGEPEKELWVELPACEQPESGEKMARKLLREVPGTKTAPRNWWISFSKFLVEEIGLVRSKLDPCVFYVVDSSGVPTAYLGLHVDDVRGRGEHEVVEYLRDRICSEFETGGTWKEHRWDAEPETWDFLGEQWTMTSEETVISQTVYIKEKVHQIPIEKKRAGHRESECTAMELFRFRSCLGTVSWVAGRTRPEVSFESSFAASRVNELRIKHLLRLNKVVRFLRARESVLCLPRLDPEQIALTVVVDAGESETTSEKWEKAQGGVCVLVVETGGHSSEESRCALVAGQSRKAPRVTHTSFDAETVVGIQGLDIGLASAMLVEEFFNGVRVSVRERIERELDGERFSAWRCPLSLHSDSNSLVTKVMATSIEPALSKRRKQDVGDLQECLAVGDLREFLHINGKMNATDALTKCSSKCQHTIERLIELVAGWYKPVLGGDKTVLAAYVAQQRRAWCS